MFRKLLFVFACFISIPSLAQERDGTVKAKDSALIFFDDFNDNRNKWTVGRDKHRSATIDSGFYHLTSLGHAYGEGREVRINSRKDFQVEARIKIVSGKPLHKHYFSMLFWGREAMNSYYFTFSGDRFASVELCDGKSKSSCTPEKDSYQESNLDPLAFNTYTIKKIGKAYAFYINGEQFYSMPFKPFYGNLLGFGAGRQVTLAVDYIKVSYL